MTEREGSPVSSPEERARQEAQEAREEAERSAEAATARAAEAGAGEHVVQDAYVARRLAREAAERAEAERDDAGETDDLAGEDIQESTFGFYLTLGVIVAALLLAIIWVFGSQQELPESVRRRSAPAAPGSPGLRLGPPAGSPGLPGRSVPPISSEPRRPAGRGATTPDLTPPAPVPAAPALPGAPPRAGALPPASTGPPPGAAENYPPRPPSTIPPVPR